MNYDLSAHQLELKTRFDNWRRMRPSSLAKNHWAKWLIALSFIFAPIAFTIRYSAQSERQSASTPHAIYDSNPDHLWNRMHRAFYVRTARNGEEYGHDELDPLLWAETKHLLVGPSHQQAIKLLDDFLSVNGAAWSPILSNARCSNAISGRSSIGRSKLHFHIREKRRRCNQNWRRLSGALR